MAGLGPDKPMPLGEHLHELRRRLVLPIVVFSIGLVLGFVYANDLKQLFVHPLQHAIDISGVEVAKTAGIVVDQAQPFRMLKTLQLGESMWVTMSLAMWLGVKRIDLIKPIKEKDETDGAVV